MPDGYLWSYVSSVACLCSAIQIFWAWLISSGPGPFVLFFSAMVAFKGYRSNQEHVRKRATLDTISRSQSTRIYLEGREVFDYYAARDPRALGCLANKSFSQHQRLGLVTHLNHYEEIAVGVREEILDKDHLERFLKGLVVETWHKGAFFIYQHSWDRDQDTGALSRTKDKDKPQYKLAYFSELKKLAREFGADPNLFPKDDGTWGLKPDDIKDLLGVLRIRKPEDDKEASYVKMCEDLAKMTEPLEPNELEEIAKHSVYHCSGPKDDEKVLEPEVCNKHWAPKTAEQELAEIVTAIGNLTDVVTSQSRTSK